MLDARFVRNIKTIPIDPRFLTNLKMMPLCFAFDYLFLFVDTIKSLKNLNWLSMCYFVLNF